MKYLPHPDWSGDIEKAVEYWCAALRKTEKPDRDNNTTRDPIETFLVESGRARPSFDEEQIQLFGDRLHRAIHLYLLIQHLSRLENQNEPWFQVENLERYHIAVGTDYHPDRILCIAAQGAGIRDGVLNKCLPWKTMVVLANYAPPCVSEGYGAPFVEI